MTPGNQTIDPLQQSDPRELYKFLQRVQPPGALYVTVDDLVLFKGWAPFTTVPIVVSMRVLTSSGEVIPYNYAISVGALNTTSTNRIITGVEGFILTASITAATGGRGQVFCQLSIERGRGTSDTTFGQVFLQGYPSLWDALTFPNGNIESSVSGYGLPAGLSLAAPIAGADFTFTIFGGLNWKIRALTIVLTASAAVANRFPVLQILNPASLVEIAIPPVAAITASQVVRLCWAPGLNNANLNNVQNMGFPNEYLSQQNCIIRLVTTGLDAADQYSVMIATIENYMGF